MQNLETCKVRRGKGLVFRSAWDMHKTIGSVENYIMIASIDIKCLIDIEHT